MHLRETLDLLLANAARTFQKLPETTEPEAEEPRTTNDLEAFEPAAGGQ